MKYLEEPRIHGVNGLLASNCINGKIIEGKLEPFSCKKGTSDKKLSKHLEEQYAHELATSPKAGPISSSPLGPLTDPSTRRLLINLITTMNASFPDYDFSNLRPDQFHCFATPSEAVNIANKNLSESVEVEHPGFLTEMWSAVEESIKPAECEIFSYVPDMESDPFSDGNLWSFNFFFHNKNMKKILYMTCMAKSIGDESFNTEEYAGDEYDMYNDGDDAQGGVFEWEDDVDM